jgi:hypothetical protein
LEGIGMEKQLQLFIKEKHDNSELWFLWPEETRKIIENGMATLIIKIALSSIKEDEAHEKR